MLAVIAPNPILILILMLGGLESWRRWRCGTSRRAGVLPRQPDRRWATGIAYVALAVLLSLGDVGEPHPSDV